MRQIPPLNPIETDRLVDALARLHQRKQPLPEALAQEVKEATEKGTANQVFTTAERQLHQHEQQLATHARLSKTLVGQLKNRQLGLVQRLLRLVGPTGGDFRGRFLVENDTGKKADFLIKPRFTTPCTLEPASFPLSAGENQVVTLGFASLPGAPGTSLELAIDVEADGYLRARIWVEVRFDPA